MRARAVFFLKPLLRDNECYRRLLPSFSSENATFLSEEGLNDLALLEWQSEPDTSSTIFDGPPSPTGEGLYRLALRESSRVAGEREAIIRTR